MGGAKFTPFKDMLEKHPERVIELAVKGMMPKNNLGRLMRKKLRVYAGPEHPHEGQQPEASWRSEMATTVEQYHGVGRRKTSVARVYLRPGSGNWEVNGRPLEEYLPRHSLQQHARSRWSSPRRRVVSM